jgi:hypothetical protein
MKNNKRKILENISNICKKVKVNTEFNKNEFVSPSQLKNFVLKDPIIDYLEYYKINYPKQKSYVKKKITNKKNNFEDFIKNKGIEYEKKVMEKFINKSIVIQGPVNANSYNKTIDALNNNSTIIYQGVLFNEINKTYGCPDLIIRGDKLNELFNENEPIDKYYIIDIKFSSIKLSADKSYILNSDMIPTYKTQILLYTQALNKLLNQNVTKGFILAKKYFSESRGVKDTIINNTFDTLATIKYDSVDNHYNEILNNAINWIFKLRNEGSCWKLLPKPSINELYPNMSNNKDGKWRPIKKELAEKINELTLLVNVGYQQRKNAFNHNIYSYKDEGCNSSILGLNGKRGIIVDEIISINSSSDLIRPSKINYSIVDWRKLPDNQMEFYLDYETTSNFNDLSFIFMIGVGFINKKNKWEFKCLVAKNDTLIAQVEMFNDFWSYIDKILLEHKKDDGIFIHWTHAEQTFFNKIRSLIQCKDKIFLDLYQMFIAEPIVIKGALNFSLKTIANTMYNHGMIKVKWNNSSLCSNGLDAMIIANQLYENNLIVKLEDMKEIAQYNEIDCKVLYEILNYLRINH